MFDCHHKASAYSWYGPHGFKIGGAKLGHIGKFRYGRIGGIKMGRILGIPYGEIGGLHSKSILGAANPNAEEPDMPAGAPGSHYEHEEHSLGAPHYADQPSNDPMPGPIGGAGWVPGYEQSTFRSDNEAPDFPTVILHNTDMQYSLGMAPQHAYESQMLMDGGQMPMPPPQMTAADPFVGQPYAEYMQPYYY